MIYINEDLCKGCFICVDCCPVGVYTPSKQINQKGVHVPVPQTDKCIKCKLCTLMCPDQVISVEDD